MTSVRVPEQAQGLQDTNVETVSGPPFSDLSQRPDNRRASARPYGETHIPTAIEEDHCPLNGC